MKKFLKIILYIFLGFIALAVIGNLLGDDTDTNTEATPEEVAEDVVNDNTEEDNDEPVEVNSNYRHIAGLMPVDVYLNFDNIGFETETTFNSEYGNLWKSTKSDAGIDYEVTTFTYDNSLNGVERVAAMAMTTSKSIEAVKPFLKFSASILYDGAKPEVAAKWIEDNFNKAKSTIIIGGVQYELIAPSEYVRMLNISMPIN